jgi:hypothetical protein
MLGLKSLLSGSNLLYWTFLTRMGKPQFRSSTLVSGSGIRHTGGKKRLGHRVC